MKTFLTLSAIAILTAGSALACPDFSGNYKYTDPQAGEQSFSLMQKGCEAIDIVSATSAQTLWFDGVSRVIAEQDQYVVTEKNLWEGDTVVTLDEAHSKATGEMLVLARTEYVRQPNGDIVQTTRFQVAQGNAPDAMIVVFHRVQ